VSRPVESTRTLILVAIFPSFSRLHSEVEFWSGQPSRLHDRARYLRLDEPTADGKKWKIDRLSP
jgi:pyridoxine/pyridoxamine 5'-phosphate oxidase